MEYKDFLLEKRFIFNSNGVTIKNEQIHSFLFPFQKDLTRWAVKKGRCAIFADTGLGKTFMQLEWARLISGKCLIIAPLSVARQTVNEAKKIGLAVNYVRHNNEIVNGINITNYEMADQFDASQFDAVVLDESSILKGLAGKTKQLLTDKFINTKYKLCCTATPAPNDIAEIANHAEFLGIMTRANMLSSFFVHDDEGWRLKKHAVTAFYRWLASWGMSIRKPSDLGYDDDGYILPALYIKPVFLNTDYSPDDKLFFTGLQGIGDRAKVRKYTIGDKIETVKNIVKSTEGQFIIWCGLNDESNLITKELDDAREVQGSDDIEYKIKTIQEFQDGKFKCLITKSKIAGFGMNFQNCHNQIFLGLSDSFESYYQCIRRSWRFGQKKEVNVNIVLTEIERDIYNNVISKEAEAVKMSEELIKNVQQYEKAELDGIFLNGWEYNEKTIKSENGWTLMLGDCVERSKEIESDSIDMSVFSPPFIDLYSYSPTERDIGNSKNKKDYEDHFNFLVPELLRITKQGRICAVHVADVPAMLARDGYIGMKDFSGDIIRLFMKHGWIFDARIPIDKNQQAQSIRTHTKALTMTQFEKDRTWLRPALPDYILKFRKPGENQILVNNKEISRNDWIEWANPTWPNEDRCAESGAYATWYGIRESDTLQGWASGKWHKRNGGQDEKHICPLQLGTIERCIRLWSNAGETVLSPFMGIGSEGYQAILFGRKFMGIELKPEYFKEAVKNVSLAWERKYSDDLFGKKETA